MSVNDPWGMIIFFLGLALIAVAILRLLYASNLRIRMVFLGFMSFGACLVVNSAELYPAFDSALGGGNRAYLVVQLSFLLGLFAFRGAVTTEARVQTMNRDLIILGATAAAIIIFWLLAVTPETSHRVEMYRTQWAVIGYTQALNVYAIYATAEVVRYVTPALKQTPNLLKRGSLILLATGFLSGGIASVIRISGTIFEATGTVTYATFSKIDGALVITTLFMILLAGAGLVLTAATADKRENVHIS
ncbi:hypothetical protein [Lysinibacter sp. HNR]|uniref:hypothetical protein n=1 Tax=Lysinibacter sp. HNR TaxID=3031408 RepID=UPI002435A841|nr:hypothetical protein [Lysinibacter sp. HNR]WGD37549.1 hypothetical protein FrondiHNR_01095 [Lysinibacter sp. HNR]